MTGDDRYIDFVGRRTTNSSPHDSSFYGLAPILDAAVEPYIEKFREYTSGLLTLCDSHEPCQACLSSHLRNVSREAMSPPHRTELKLVRAWFATRTRTLLGRPTVAVHRQAGGKIRPLERR